MGFSAPAELGMGAVRTARRSKRIDTKVSILLGLQFPLFLSLAKIGERRPLRKKGTAEDFYYRRGAQCAPISLPIRSVRYFAATHKGNSALGAAQGELPEGQERVPWGITVPHNS